LILFIFIVIIFSLYFINQKGVSDILEDSGYCPKELNLKNDSKDIYSCLIMDNLSLVFTPGEKIDIKREDTGEIVNTFKPSNYSDVEDGVTFFTFSSDSYDVSVLFDDINYDGFKDISMEILQGAYNYEFDFYVYDKDDFKYKPEENLHGLINPYFNMDTGTITEFGKGRAYGDIYSENIYKSQEDSSYKKIKNCERGFLLEDSLWPDETDLKYLLVCKELNSNDEWEITDIEFDGIGNEIIRSCSSFDCEAVKYGAYSPSIKILEQSGDWYKVDYVNKGVWDDQVGESVYLPEEHWGYTRGWTHKENIPEEVRDLFKNESVSIK